jgi:hypothetical protein
LQQGPWKESVFRNVVPGGAAGAAPVKFRPVGRRSSPGKDWGRAYGLLGVDLGCWARWWWHRRAARRRLGRGGRGGAGSGELGRPAAQPREGGASMGSRRGVGQLEWRRNSGEGDIHRAAPMAAGGGHGTAGGLVRRGWLAGGSPFMVDTRAR